MSKADRRLTRFVQALIANRRPPRSPADDDSAAMQVAARLRAAHPGGSTPSPAFVDTLARQLREAADHEPGWTEAGIRRRRFPNRLETHHTRHAIFFRQRVSVEHRR